MSTTKMNDSDLMISELSNLPEQELEDFKNFIPQYLEAQNQENFSSRSVSKASSSYVEAEAQWWGLVFTLSDQAAKDLSSGTTGIAAVSAAITTALAAVPGVNLAMGIITGIIGIHAAAIGLMNRGNGVYITAPWPYITLPLFWIPTPR